MSHHDLEKFKCCLKMTLKVDVKNIYRSNIGHIFDLFGGHIEVTEDMVWRSNRGKVEVPLRRSDRYSSKY